MLRHPYDQAQDRLRTPEPVEAIRQRILERNAQCDRFFGEQALLLARACKHMAERFSKGGRLLAFGRGAYATDAMHVSVEFIHPVIVGKRALPALDISMAYDAWIRALTSENDMAIAFGPPQGDPNLSGALQAARERGAFTIAWPGTDADFAVRAPSDDPHLHQELFELLGHTMYESVHVFLEHLSRHHGDHQGLEFLYPFLDDRSDAADTIVEEVAASIRMKARDADALREQVAAQQSGAIAAAAEAIRERLARGGRILAFGNGGSATDATDFALDCVMPDRDWPPIPAVSLALEPAVLTATANDVGVDVIFLRQLIAQASPHDIVVAFTTSGGSRNVVAALEEARKHGLLTIALLGYDGGEIARRNLADIPIVVRCDYIPRIQEAQGTIYHVLREALAYA
jgi:D-sedoheptulose 7-phosphate isomerase